jgi:lipopolysaccharide transport system permease protein
MFGFSKRDIQSVASFTKLNIVDRYLGSAMGSFWALANPLLMLALYTFVFGFVFKSRLPGASTTLGYAIWLISGYGPWLAISEGIVGATQSIVGNTGIVKNIAMKSEILTIAASLTGVVSMLVNFVFLLVLLPFDGNSISWHVVFLIPAVVLQFSLIIGFGLFFAAINVFFRDFGIVLPNLLTMVLFATPIFYPLESIPRVLRFLASFNPIFIVADSYRKALVFHEVPNLLSLAMALLFSFALIGLGLKFFRRLKGHFESAL